MILKPFRVETEDGKTFNVAHESTPRREPSPDRAARCELIQAISLAVVEAFKIEDVQRLGLVVDEAMRKMED